MALKLRALALFASSAYTPGSVANYYTYATTDALATVIADGYFNDARAKLKAGDVIHALCNHAAASAPDYAVIRVVSAPTSGNVTVATDVDAAGGGARAVVPTADGLTTGLILPTDKMVEATSANANHILKLPAASAATRGKEIFIWVVPSTNCELQTAVGSGNTINNVDCSGGAVEALLTHSQFYIARQHLATGWLLQAFTALGAVATAIVPD